MQGQGDKQAQHKIIINTAIGTGPTVETAEKQTNKQNSVHILKKPKLLDIE